MSRLNWKPSCCATQTFWSSSGRRCAAGHLQSRPRYTLPYVLQRGFSSRKSRRHAACKLRLESSRRLAKPKVALLKTLLAAIREEAGELLF